MSATGQQNGRLRAVSRGRCHSSKVTRQKGLPLPRWKSSCGWKRPGRCSPAERNTTLGRRRFLLAAVSCKLAPRSPMPTGLGRAVVEHIYQLERQRRGPGSPVDAFRGTSASGAVVPAAVDVDHLSGDVIRRRGGEEGRNPGDICRGACAAGGGSCPGRRPQRLRRGEVGLRSQTQGRFTGRSPDMLSTINPTPAKGSRGLVSRRAGGRSMPSNRQAYRVRWRCRRPRPGRVRGSRPGSA